MAGKALPDAEKSALADSDLWSQGRRIFEDEVRKTAQSKKLHKEAYQAELENFFNHGATAMDARQWVLALQTRASSQYSEGSITIRGRKIIPKHCIEVVVQNLDYVVNAGDYLVKGAPETVGLIWMAVKTGIGAVQKDYSIVSSIVVALHDLTSIFVRCRAKVITFCAQINDTSDIEDQMFKRIPEIYAKMLDFSFSVQRYLRKGFNFQRWNPLSPNQFESKMQDINKLERQVIKDTGDVANHLMITFQDHATSSLVDLLEKQNDSSKAIDAIQEDVSANRLLLSQVSASVDQSAIDTAALTLFQQQRHNLDVIEKTLALHGQPWHEIQEELFSQRAPDTGDWLLRSDSQFLDWAATDHPSRRILLIEGREGSGKSHIVSFAVNFLLKLRLQDDRVSVAYYYNDGSSNNDALKAFIWQIAESKAQLASELCSLCRQEAELGGLSGIWKQSLAHLTKMSDATLFFVLDGCDDELMTTLADLTKEAATDHKGAASIRILLSGRLNTFKDLRSVAGNVIQDLGNVPFSAEIDTGLYAEERLNSMEMFRDATEDRLQQLKQRISSTLSQGVEGDFKALESKLRQINECGTESAIEHVLAHAKDGRLATVAQEIERINNSLHKFELEDINAILPWVVDAFESLTVEQFSAILSLRDTAQSLLPLESQIRNRYFALFNVDRKRAVSLQSEAISDCLKDVSYRSQSADLQPSEISMVEHIIKTHFTNIFGEAKGHEVYERFHFENFFSQQSFKTDRIKLLDRSANDLEMAYTCLKVIANTTSDPAIMEDYAYEWLIAHLHRCDRARSDPSARQRVVELLFKCLRDPEIALKWWYNHRNARRMELLTPSRLEILFEWLTDVTLQPNSLMSPDQLWVASLRSGNSINLWWMMENIAQTVAAQWVRMEGEYDDVKDWREAFDWLYIYHFKVSCRETFSDPERCLFYRDNMQDCEHWREVVQPVYEWSRSRIRADFTEDEWQYCWGKTAIWKGRTEAIEEARSAFESISDKLPGYWRVTMNLARILIETSSKPPFKSPQWEEMETTALSLVRPIIESWSVLMKSDARFQKADRDGFFERPRDLYKRYAMWKGDETILREVFWQGFNHKSGRFMEDYTVLATLWGVLYYRHKFDECMDLIGDLAEDSSPPKLKMLEWALSKSGRSLEIITSARKSGKLEILAAACRNTIANFDMNANWMAQDDKWYKLNKEMGFALWYLGDKQRDQALETWEAAAYRPPRPYADSYWLKDMQARKAPQLLISAYTSRALPLAKATDTAKLAPYCLRLMELDLRFVHNDSQIHPDKTRAKFQIARVQYLAGNKAKAHQLLCDFITKGLSDGYKSRSITYHGEEELDPYDSAEENFGQGHEQNWLNVVRSLLVVGDETNGLAMLRRRLLYLHPPESFDDMQRQSRQSIDTTHLARTDSNHNTDEGSSGKNGKDEDSDLTNLCLYDYGRCSTIENQLDEAWLCIDCAVTLCTSCYGKLQRDRLFTESSDAVFCEKDHEFVMLPNKTDIDERTISSWSKKTILVGEEEIQLTEWYDRVKRQWVSETREAPG